MKRRSLLLAGVLLSTCRACFATAEVPVPAKKVPEVTTFAGSTIAIPCGLKAQESSPITWIREKDAHILTSGTFAFSADARISPKSENEQISLMIKFVQLRDSGFYFCQTGKDKPARYRVKLIVNPRRTRITTGDGKTEMRAGSTIYLTCRREQIVPGATFTWTHTNILLKNDMRFDINTVTDRVNSLMFSVLTITNSTAEDAGTYTCQPSGSELASIEIIIREDHPPTLHVEGVTFVSVSLSWKHEMEEPEADVQYILRYRPDHGDEEFSVVTNIDSTTYVVEGLMPMTEYAFIVQTVRPNGEVSPPSEKLLVTTAALSFSLLRAVENGHLSVVKDLLELDPDIDEGDGMYLKMASQMGHLDVVNYLLGAGADPDADEDGEAVQEAAKNGHLDVVKALLVAGADANVGDGMHYAVENDRPDIVKLLHQYGADVNKPLPEEPWKDPETGARYGFNWTAMHVAARWGKASLVKLLYELGSDIKVKDPKGDTPLHVAVKYPQIWFVRELLKYCPDLHLRNNDGKTVIDLVEDLPHAIYSSLSSEEGVKLRHLVANITLEKIKTSSSTEEAAVALEDEVETLIECNKTISDLVDSVASTDSHVDIVLQELFEDTVYLEIEDAFADYLCTREESGEWRAKFGVRYIAECRCIPGKGPTLQLRDMDESGGCDDISPRFQ